MATFGALRHPWNRLSHPYRTRVLCLPNLCPHIKFPRNFGDFCGHSRPAPLPQQGRGRGFDSPENRCDCGGQGELLYANAGTQPGLAMRLLPESG